MSQGDYGDVAAKTETFLRDNSLKERKPAGPSEIGMCYYCEEPLASGRWCDKECQELWEAEVKAKARR